jgi:hypothetical protein
MFSPGGYNRGLHGRPQARTLTATIVQRLVDECPMSAMESALGRCRLNVRITPGSGRRADIGGRQRSADFVAEVGDYYARGLPRFVDTSSYYAAFGER